MTSRWKKPLLIFLLTTALVGGAATAFYYFFVKPPLELARSTAEGFRQFFNFTPQVTVDQVIIFEQTMPIAELATVSRELFIETTWTHTWLGSTKTITLRGVYIAKAGFDLRESFSVAIENNPLRVTASMPPAKLLSLELREYYVVRDKSGFWNRVSESDRERAVLMMQQDARLKAEQSGMIEESQRSVKERIRQIIEGQGATVEFHSRQ